MDISEVLRVIREAAYEVRLNLAPGYLESVYRNALMHELSLRGLASEKEVPIPVMYKGHVVGDFRADLLVAGSVILELKATKDVGMIHETQLVNYLVDTGIDHGFLINYGGDKFRIIHKIRLLSK